MARTRRREAVESAAVLAGDVPEAIVDDFRIAVRSRIASEIANREVFAGRAPFAITGDGKELAQVALAREFQPGDWRCGYYRDQTLLMATGLLSVRQFFANLYADPAVDHEPGAGRQMANHYSSRILDDQYRAHAMLDRRHSAADASPVSVHLGKALGLALASKLYRARPFQPEFSMNGNEVVFATVGNGGTSEGIFWEMLNAAGVLQVPLVLSIWDDEMAISVPNAIQTTKGSISALLEGFRVDRTGGIGIHVVRGDSYVDLRRTYRAATRTAREQHTPAVIHVTHMTQPFGHSSSGSHERYKTPDRLEVERELDPIRRMRAWLLDDALATPDQLDEIEREERHVVEREREAAWRGFQSPIEALREEAAKLLEALDAAEGSSFARTIATSTRNQPIHRRLILDVARDALFSTRRSLSPAAVALREFVHRALRDGRRLYGSHLYSESPESPTRLPVRQPIYVADAPLVDGRIVLRDCFDANLDRDQGIVIFGEDVGLLGDVNLVFEGLQSKHGHHRITDTGIREATIVGQCLGLAQRGFRPIADIQYLDYMLYALELASDDLASLHHRTAGGQKAPVIIRTKGHRLQGMWHAGSPMAVLLHSLRGMYVVVPRNMTQAAGFYNTLLRGDNPAIVVEVLNGYRRKECVPSNVGDFLLPLGRPDILREGRDLTIVTYGACCQVVLEAAGILNAAGLSVEVIDIQTLNPFDVGQVCAQSVAKTGALLVVDEDVPGAASAYLLQQIIERDAAIDTLDVPPRTLTAAEHRTPFGPDGDYFTKPSVHDVVGAAYGIASTRRPRQFSPIATQPGERLAPEVYR